MENNLLLTPYIFYSIIAGYLVGSIPFGYLIFLLSGKGDIRKKGSKNIGATNVYRLAGKKLAFLTLLLDISKAMLVCYIVYNWYGSNAGYLTSLSIILGHMFPIWLKFRGGKGVATAFGIIAIISWPLLILASLIWLITVKLFKFSSIGAITTIIIIPLIFKIILYLQFNHNLFLWIPGEPKELSLLLIISTLILIKHIPNIKALLKKGPYV